MKPSHDTNSRAHKTRGARCTAETVRKGPMNFEIVVGAWSEGHAKVERPARPRLLIPWLRRGRDALVLHGTGEPGGRGPGMVSGRG